MKLNIISDIHAKINQGFFYDKTLDKIKFPNKFDINQLEKSDVLVIAGDFCTGGSSGTNYTIDYFKKHLGKNYNKLVYIKGNHDFYCTDNWEYTCNFIPPHKDRNKVTVIDNVAFICSTLWSPIEDMVDACLYGMNDYNYIRISQGIDMTHWFSITDNNQLFMKNMKWLIKTVKKHQELGHKTIVVTHHVPLPELIDMQYKSSPLNEAFAVMHEKYANEFRNLGADIWIHGHSHNFCDTTINGTRYIRNPLGYSFGGHNECNYKYDCVIEI